jgi:hypothetical protein
MRQVVSISLALIVLALIACGGGDDDTAPTATRGASSTPAGGSSTTATSEPTQSDANFPDVHAPLEVGSSAEVESSNPDPFAPESDQMGTVEVTIVSIMDPAETTSEIFQPEAGNRFWAVEVTMEATGDKDVNTGEWTLRTTDGSEYETSLLTGVGDDIIYGAIKPGETRQGVVVFEIPEGATIEWLYMDPSIYVGGNLIFDA